jgi:hypothetical protein
MSTESVPRPPGLNGNVAAEGTWRSALVTFGPSVVLDLLLAASVVATAVDKLPDPDRGTAARLVRTAASVGALLPWAYVLIARPWHLRWGATDEETRKALPGDGLVPQPVTQMTRALTVDAPPGEVWPWMVQLGAGRGGLYSYDWLENLAGLGIHSVDRIVPELQDLEKEEILPLEASSGTGLTVAEIVPERAIVLHLPELRPERSVLSWAYVLEPLGQSATRLIFRFKLDAAPRWAWRLGYPLLVEIPHFVM